MATKKTSTTQDVGISDILKITTTHVTCCVLGTSPLILNRMSEKAKRELLMPKGKKTAFDKATTLKHVPVDEYQASVYKMKPGSPTFLGIMATSFKKAISTAALDMPGARKSQIGRLTFVTSEYVNIYGVQQLFMSVTRSADMNKTPDVRTRAIVPQWACRLTIAFVEPLIKLQAVLNLLAAAGITMGVGDWRQEKGSGSYGQFELVAEDDPRYVKILTEGGWDAQIDAHNTPVCYDDETAELLSWYDDERVKRQRKGAA